MPRKGQRPALFTNTKEMLGNLTRAMVNEVLVEAEQKAVESGATTQRMPNYLQVTESRMAKQGVIDLKPFFARSTKKKYNKKGEWYLYIPIPIKTRQMSRRMYDDIRGVQVPTGASQVTVKTDYLYDRRKTSPAVPRMNYKPKSTNVSIIPQKWGSSTRNTYVSFRTVTANSPANSWIINRNKVNEDDMSKSLIANIDRLMKWKMNNIGG